MSYFDLPIEDKLVQANTYYGAENHIRHFDWAKYPSDSLKAGINQAQREVDLYLGTSLAESYGDDDFPLSDWDNFRPDLAIFEHALFILDNTARTRHAATSAQDIESEEYQEEERNSGVTLSPQATRFLQMNRGQVMRG